MKTFNIRSLRRRFTDKIDEDMCCRNLTAIFTAKCDVDISRRQFTNTFCGKIERKNFTETMTENILWRNFYG